MDIGVQSFSLDKGIVLGDTEKGVYSHPEDDWDEGFRSLPEDELDSDNFLREDERGSRNPLLRGVYSSGTFDSFPHPPLGGVIL